MGSLTSVEIVEYLNDVKQAYQSGGSELDKTVRVADWKGRVAEFRKFGTFNMIPRGAFKSVVDAVTTSHELVECRATPFVLPITTDEFEQAGSGGEAPQEQREGAIACGFAMRRQRDYSVIAAAEAASPTTITAGAGLTVAKLKSVLLPFDKYEMRAISGSATGDSGLYTLITENQHDNLLADSITQNIQTSNFKSLVDGRITDFAGQKLMLIGTGRGSLGLAADGGVRRCYSYVKSAMGQVCSKEPQVEYGREILMTIDVLMGKLMVGSVNVDVNGLVEIDCTEA